MSARGERDRELGLFRSITRRDNLHGMGSASVGALASPRPGFAGKDEAGPASGADDYPPARTGMRGNHPGSLEVTHERTWNDRQWRDPRTLDESYDLVVVGGGISGLAAAYYYRRATGENARILILDNHDDFGGHAKRNEFRHSGRTHVALGGSVFLEYPSYSEVARDLLRDLGVNIETLLEKQDRNFIYAPLALKSGVYFDASTYGRDVTITGDVLPLARTGADGVPVLAHHVEAMPLSASARRELTRFLTERTDYLSDIPDAEKPVVLRKISYQDFLIKHVGLSEEAAQIFHRFPQPYYGLGTDAQPAYDGLMFGMPGLRGLGQWGSALEEQLGDFSIGMTGALFADGNASVARLLTRALVPEVAAGSTMQDVITAQFDYARLDRPESTVRIRLSSTAVHVDPLPGDEGSDVTYVRGGNAYRVRTRNCVLACYNTMIPSLCPGLPEEQKQALQYGQKSPVVASNVLLREGAVLERVGASSFYSPGRLHGIVYAHGRTLGRYESGWNPAEPVAVQLLGALAPGTAGLTEREQYIEGRQLLLDMSFQDFEREIRTHLGGMFGEAGFDAARDILAITVNRWPYGYAYERNSLFDPDWPEGQAPNEIGRRRFGRISIANSDAGYHPYVDGAIDQAHRAVQELVEAGLV